MIPKTRSFHGGFDYGKYLASQKVSRIFNGFGRRSAERIEPARPSFLGTVLAARRLIHRRLECFLPFPENQLMAALLIGSREKLPGEIRDTFARTGTAHILAVSGLNVSMVGGMLFFLLRAARLPRKVSAFVAMAAVTFYVLISGANPPVLRAGIMGGILMFGLMSERKSELLNTLAFAFFALLFVNPRNLFAVDFQLSFLCVCAIFFALPERRQPAAGLRAVFVFYRDILASTLAATVGTLPLTLRYFHLFSPVSVPANLALVPLMNFATAAGFLILPGMLAGDLPPFLGVVPALALRLSLALNEKLARLPYACFVLPPPPVLTIWVYYGAVLALWLLVRRGKGRISLWSFGMMGVSLVVLAVFAQSVRRDLSLRIHALKTKEGNIAVVEMPARRRHLIVQPGDKKWGREWRWTVKPFLEELGAGSAEAIVFGSLDARSTAEIRDAVRACRPRRVFLAAPEKGRSYKRERILEAFGRDVRPQAVFLGTDQEFLKLSGVSFRWRRDQNVSMLELTYANRKILLLLRGEVPSRGSHPVIDLQAVPHAMTLRFHPWNPAASVES
jgi:competence protein ComEC